MLGVNRRVTVKTKMITIRELRVANNDVAVELSQLHMRAFPNFFLTQLGLPFLKTLYLGYMEDLESGIIVAEKDGRVVGFLAYSNNYSMFFKNLMKKHLIRFAFCSVLALLRHPSFLARIMGALKKSESVEREEKYVELASLCVDPNFEKQGIGTKLINYLKNTVDFDTFAYISLETDADNNEEVNRFYRKNDFKLAREYSTPYGRRMNEYRYKG